VKQADRAIAHDVLFFAPTFAVIFLLAAVQRLLLHPARYTLVSEDKALMMGARCCSACSAWRCG
jgi:inner membrane protein involved in colicin E2 resistance